MSAILLEISIKSPQVYVIMCSGTSSKTGPHCTREDSVRARWKIAGLAPLVAALGVVAVGTIAAAQAVDDGADGFVFQSYNLLPRLTAVKNAMLPPTPV